MQNTIQMPLVHVMGNKLGAENNMSAMAMDTAHSGTFLAKLTAVLNGEQGQVSGEAITNHATLAQLYSQFISEALPEDGVDVEHILSPLITLLSASPDELQQVILANPELQQWFTLATQMLDEVSLTTGHNAPGSNEQPNTDALQLVSNTKEQVQTQIGQMQKIIADFLNLTQQSTGNVAVQEHANVLKQLLPALLATMQQSSSNGGFETMNATQSGATTVQSNLLLLMQQMNNRLGLSQSLVTDESNNAAKATTLSIASVNSDAVSSFNSRMTPLIHHIIQPVISVETGVSNELAQAANADSTTNQLPLAQTLSYEGARLVTSEQQVSNQHQAYINAQQFSEQAGPLIIKHLKLAQLNNGISEARISLVPEHLGQVNIHITMKNGQMVAQFMAENLMGKQVLEGQLSQLRTVLQEQGIQVERLEVVQGEQSSLFQQPREQHTAKHAMELNKTRKPGYDLINDDFSLDFREDETYRSRMYGSSFEAVI